MTHKLRSDTTVFAVGFLLNHDEIAELAKRALSDDFLANHGDDVVLAFKWHLRDHACEALVTDRRERFLVAIHFYPWVLGEPAPSELADIPLERRELWNQRYGRFAPECTYAEASLPYPLQRLGGTRVLSVGLHQAGCPNSRSWRTPRSREAESVSQGVDIGCVLSYPTQLPLLSRATVVVEILSGFLSVIRGLGTVTSLRPRWSVRGYRFAHIYLSRLSYPVATTMKDLTSLAEEASAIAAALSRLQTSAAEDLAKVKAQAEQLAAELTELVEGKLFHATRLTAAPQLRYSACPDPEYVPGLPPAYLRRVFRNVQPPDSPGVLYESMVDRLACAFFAHYFPPTHQFLLQPQHTFRRVAPEDANAVQGHWSITANDGEGSSRMDLSAATVASAVEDSLEMEFSFTDPQASSSPPRRFAIPKPRADGPSQLAGVGLDVHDRFVDTTPSGLRKPDISVVYQGIPSQSDPKLVEQYIGLPTDVTAPAVEVPVAMGESKLKDQNAAVRQLIRYAKDFSRDVSPDMRFFAFALRDSGLEVAMYRFAGDSGTDLEPILLSPASQQPWFPVYHEAVHREMCSFSAEVQSSWQKHGLCWAYDAEV
ncbi:hypothetical protein MSAN_02094600 [Mycena sanguinolenta]|uniref:Uncharacterized protein n=1 Tax=Mycena sanguinolenta TaxID=230812 RepID=A0A8H6XGJ6_9AGAR|nr:hypothetical protein MSAN_02094600 [Mycena sanguinolenta]